MLPNRILIKKLFIPLLLCINISTTTHAQEMARVHPTWWVGESGAVNINNYRGTTQILNSNVTVPTAFNQGNGVKPYGALLIEYRPKNYFGGMLNIAYDNRGGKFNTVTAPCNCPADLTVNLSYLSVEPSLRIAPFGSAFYLFAGPTLSVNLNKDFIYNQQKQPEVRGDLSTIRKTILSAQAGAGIDIPVSARSAANQMTISPFVSYLTNLGQSPRTTETWSVYTIRAGIALKFGKGRVSPVPLPLPEPMPVAVVPLPPAPVFIVDGIQFSIFAPITVPAIREVQETFPIRNYVFFDEGSAEIPIRYVKLDKNDALNVNAAESVMPDPKDLGGRPHRQLTAYYNVLNILGYRMRTNPSTNVTLIGASAGKGVEIGRQYAESVKLYLVNVFGIDATRIVVEGRNQPVYPSEKPGATKELALLREGDRRVDIVSNSPLLTKPLQIKITSPDPEERFIKFKTESSEHQSLKSWTLDIKDQNGMAQHYGPFTSGEKTISGNTILGDQLEGRYSVKMEGQTNDGLTIKRESTLHLIRNSKVKEEGLRFSILFDFNVSHAVSAYEKFLTDVVTPRVPNYSTVVIHGHTDIIGTEAYNLKLSKARANETMKILKRTLAKAGKIGIQFDANGYGKDINAAPFDNKYPEERFYNRTVIIDIAPIK